MPWGTVWRSAPGPGPLPAAADANLSQETEEEEARRGFGGNEASGARLKGSCVLKTTAASGHRRARPAGAPRRCGAGCAAGPCPSVVGQGPGGVGWFPSTFLRKGGEVEAARKTTRPQQKPCRRREAGAGSGTKQGGVSCSVFPGEKSAAGAGTDPGGRPKAWRPTAGGRGARCASPAAQPASSRPPRGAGCTPGPAGQTPLTGAPRRGWAPGKGAVRRLPRQMPGAPWKAEIRDATATASFPPRCREAGHDPGAPSSFGAGMRSQEVCGARGCAPPRRAAR